MMGPENLGRIWAIYAIDMGDPRHDPQQSRLGFFIDVGSESVGHGTPLTSYIQNVLTCRLASPERKSNHQKTLLRWMYLI